MIKPDATKRTVVAQINRFIRILYSIAKKGELPPFLYYSLFEINAQSPKGSAKHLYGMFVNVARKCVLVDVLRFGI